jgi:fatty acid desaturase
VPGDKSRLNHDMVGAALNTGSIFSRYSKKKKMRSILYIIAIVLFAGWVLAVFYWNAGGLVHIMILLAVIFLLFGVIKKA